MAENYITVNNQSEGVNVATRLARATPGGSTRVIQLASLAYAGFDVTTSVYTDWIATADTVEIGSFPGEYAFRMIDTKDKTSVVLCPKVNANFTEVTLIPVYCVENIDVETQVVVIFAVGAGKPIVFTASDIIPENGTPVYRTLPIQKIDTMGADYVAFYVQSLSGDGFSALFWGI